MIDIDAWADRGKAWAEYQRRAAAEYVSLSDLDVHEGYLSGFADAAKLYKRDWASSPGAVEIAADAYPPVRSAE